MTELCVGVNYVTKIVHGGYFTMTVHDFVEAIPDVVELAEVVRCRCRSVVFPCPLI